MKKVIASLFMALLPMVVHAEVSTLDSIDHIVVIYLENHSFDNLFGTFPHADGLSKMNPRLLQRNNDGEIYTTLPRVLLDGKVDARFPKDLKNAPFLFTKYINANDRIGDLTHRFYQLQYQINGGKMDQFVTHSGVGALAMGYYEEKESPLWRYAQKYTLADHFFTAAFGGSMLNHLWLVCACTPRYPNAPEKLLTIKDGHDIFRDASLTPDGFAVNTIQPFYPPYNKKYSDDAMRLPPQQVPTIGDRLSEKDISWAWYSGGFTDAAAGNPDKTFQFHHQPFVYFKNYGPDTQARKDHLKDEKDLLSNIAAGTLPAVSFYKPLGKNNLHPDYALLMDSQNHVFSLIEKIEKSSLFDKTLIIVTFDDAGGFFDHVAPPKGDRFGPGERVPALLISPYVKKGFVDHTIYDTTSILKLIETKFDLKPLALRDAKANMFWNAFE